VESTSNYEQLPKENLVSILAEKDHEIEEQQHEIEKLQNIIRNANKREFGKKSEKLSREQVELFSFDEEELPAETEVEQTAVKEHKRIKRGRKPLPADIPRERIEYEPEELSCSCCGAELTKIGEEITEELEYVPASYKVIEHVKIKRACKSCKSAGVQTGELPPSVQPLERSRPGAGLLSHIILSKYADHLPLYRQEQMFLRDGIVLSRKRMCDWIEAVVELLFPLWRALKKEVLSYPYVQADETSIKVRDLEVLKDKQKLFTGYFWAVHAPPDLAFFEYHPSRASDSAKEVLKDFKGVVQTDAYAGYNAVVLPDDVQRLACMAHIRRKFIENQKFASKPASQIIQQIAKLYKLEEKWKDLEPEEKLARRQSKAEPVFDELFQMIEKSSQSLLPKNGLQDALKYALKQKEQMKLYLSNATYHIDNNPIERQIRPIALGRKNFLFAGSHDGAKRAAVLYSLLATCKLNKVNPGEWLTDVLRRIPAHPINQISDLLPHRWKND
jgi:transposase